MRPGLVFITLFAILMAVYFALVDTLGTLPTFALQAGIVVVILIAALWLRSKTSGPWLRGHKFKEEPPEEETTPEAGNDAPAAGEQPQDENEPRRDRTG